MKKYVVSLALALLCLPAMAQVKVVPLGDHATLLKSSDARLAQNKKIAYDFWREVIEAGHVELAEKYMTENYIQHNPMIPTGRKAFIEFFSRMPKRDIKPTVTTPLAAIMAEGDLVMLAFISEQPDPRDKSKTYTTTVFDMFRIENGKVAEHWDAARIPSGPPPSGPPPAAR